VHVPYIAQVVLVPRGLAYGLPPFFDQFEDFALYPRCVHRRPLWKSPDKLVEKLFGAYLEVEGIAAVFDANVEELCHGELCGEDSR
jgi:hypothetical protein